MVRNLLITDFKNLIKLRLTLLVVFSASVSFLIGCKCQGHIDWFNWMILTFGGFLVTGSANGFNEIIERDLDRLMTRTQNRPLPSGRMLNGQALVISLFMGILGTLLLLRLNFLTGFLSVFAILLYAFFYTPMKRKSPIAVFIGAIPGALPPLIGYFAAFSQPTISWIPVVLFLIQFVWQFPHFWSIAWVLDDDYKKAGFRLLPTKYKNRTSAGFILLSSLLLLPTSLLPYWMGFGGIYLLVISSLVSVWFIYQSFKLFKTLSEPCARSVMFCSFFYLPIVQLMLLIDFLCV